MIKFDKLLTKLQALKITQRKGEWEENIPDDIWNEYFENTPYVEVGWGISVDTHGWYETATTVISMYDKFLGIHYITNMFSENQGYKDCNVKMEFMEMKEVQTITYKRVK